MTDPAPDAVEPSLTRAERRRQQTRRQRRRAAKRAKARKVSAVMEAPAAPDGSESPGVDAEGPTLEAPLPPSPVPAPEPPEPEPELVPEPERELGLEPEQGAEPEPDQALAAAGVATRAARRARPARRRRARRDRSRPPAAPPTPEQRRAEHDRRRFWTRVVPLIAAGLAAAVVVGIVVRAIDDGGATSSTSGNRSGAGRHADAVLLVHRSASGGNDMMVVAARDGAHGSYLLIPPATQLGASFAGADTLGEIPAGDDASALVNSVENVVGVGIRAAVVVDDAALTAILGPAAPLPVDLPESVEIVDRGTTYPAGAQELSAAQAAELMSGPEAGNQLEKLVTTARVLDVWLDRLRTGAVADATVALDGALEPLVAGATASDRRIETLPVDAIPSGGSERYAVREDDLRSYARRAMPSLRLGGGERPRVEILNGTGALGVATAVADKVVPAGGKVILTENVPGFGVPETQVVYYRDRWRAGAQRLLDAMGCGSLRRAGKDVKIADVTIVVGSDCPAYGQPAGGGR